MVANRQDTYRLSSAGPAHTALVHTSKSVGHGTSNWHLVCDKISRQNIYITDLRKGKPMPLEHVVEQLAAFESTGLPVVSLYLNGQANEHGGHNFDTFVHKQLPERAKTYDPNTPERESLDTDLVRINRYLEQDVRSSTRGIVIFACSGADNFFQAVQLEAPIDNNRLFIYDHPHLYPLARLLDQYQRF